FPRNIFACVDSVNAENTIRENEWRSPHSRHTDSFSFQVLNRVNVRFHARLNAQTSAVDSGQKSDIQTLLNRLQKVHHQMMRDVVATKRQCILVSRPVAPHQFGLESLFLEESLLVGCID